MIAKHWAANQGWDLNKDGQIQFVLLKGEPGHPDAEARTTYVIKELNDKGIKTGQLQLDTAMWDTAQAKDKMDAWLSGPNANKIEVVIANNDAMAMGAVEALKAHNKSSIPVFGVDALPEALALVKSGALAGTVLNDANNQAKATFDLAKNLADGKGAADGTNWKIDNKVVRVPYVGVERQPGQIQQEIRRLGRSRLLRPYCMANKVKLYGQLNDSVFRGILVGNERYQQVFSWC